MGGPHRHLLRHDEGPLHRLPGEAKLAATLWFVIAVVATPREQLWAFGVHAALVVTAAVIARVPLGELAGRLVVGVPFLAFAVLLPVLGRGPHVEVLGVQLSEPGLWAGWNIVAKGTLGVAATAVMASTTSVPHILGGLERLRVPPTLVAITAFMIRYGDVIGDELRRMRIARESRGASSGRAGHIAAVATSAGALFIRCFERGERVYLAMASRGYTGSMPARGDASASRRQWAACLSWPMLATAVAVVAIGAS